MKPKPDVFLRAAELLADDKQTFACNALAYASRDREAVAGETHAQWVDVPEVRFFLEMYSGTSNGKPHFRIGNETGFTFGVFHNYSTPDKARQHRILALLLAREVLLKGGL